MFKKFENRVRTCKRSKTEFEIKVPRVNITGKKFDRLLVLQYHGSKNHSTYWTCKCDCGNEKIVRYSHLSNKQIGSCGCSRKTGSDHPKWSGYKEICGTYICNLKNNAKKRSIDCNVNLEYLWTLYLSQDR